MIMDHLAESKRLMSAIETRDWRDESVYIDRRTAAAQVHATLALAEEQRTANLLVVARYTPDNALRKAVEALLTERVEIPMG